MRKKRDFAKNVFYHVTSRTNDKIRVFENRLGRKIMLMVLQDAKDKFHFRLTNFCIMPTHIHLLIQPEEETNLSKIMQWIKSRSARQWNCIHGSSDHVWGKRYFARVIKDRYEYEFVMNYIDQNAVKAGLASAPADWKASGAYYQARKIPDLIDNDFTNNQRHIKLLSPIPAIAAQLIPPRQLFHTLKYFGIYAQDIDRLYKLIPTIPCLGESAILRDPPVCLHYTTGIIDYFILEYDGQDTMYGRVQSNVFPAESEFRKISLSGLMNNELLKLDFSWDA